MTTARWFARAAVAVGLAVGAILGAQYGYANSAPSGSIFGPAFNEIVLSVLVVGGAGFFGVLLAAIAKTRRWGRVLLLTTAGMVLGFPFGVVAGPRYQPSVTSPGTVTLELIEPVGASLTAPAACASEANGRRIASVHAPDLGVVGVDRLSATIQIYDATTAVIDLLVNDRFGYSGSLTMSGVGIDRATGLGSFEARPESGVRLGGSTVGSIAIGTVTWRCESTVDGSPAASTPVEPRNLQGYFRFSRLIEVAEAPAMGICSDELDLATAAVETVVDWVGGKRARLRLVPGRDTATLTIDLGDGSAPETARASATLVERTIPAAPEVVGGRQLEATFELRDGTLDVYVEWECGEKEAEKP